MGFWSWLSHPVLAKTRKETISVGKGLMGLASYFLNAQQKYKLRVLFGKWSIH